jgi:hypothetical protein
MKIHRAQKWVPRGLDSETWDSTTPSLSKDFVISGGAKRHSPLLLKLQCQNSPPL